MKFLLAVACVFCAMSAMSQAPEHPESTELYFDLPKVEPAESIGAPPSDAIILFDGTSTDAFQKARYRSYGSMHDLAPHISGMVSEGVSSQVEWILANGEMEVKPGSGDIETKQAFGSIQLHIEWLSPVDEGKEGQLYSNSGIFLMGLYELQVLNSYDNTTYPNGQAGSVYKQKAPLVNASRPPGTWQEYDIIFTAPTFGKNGDMITPARMTVLHNGVLIQNNTALLGPTVYIGQTHYQSHPAELPLKLQDHGDKVRYRNIWVREL